MFCIEDEDMMYVVEIKIHTLYVKKQWRKIFMMM